MIHSGEKAAREWLARHNFPCGSLFILNLFDSQGQQKTTNRHLLPFSMALASRSSLDQVHVTCTLKLTKGRSNHRTLLPLV
jgi:hypothetical protein